MLLVVYIGLFYEQMKNFCIKQQQQYRQWRAVFVDVWSLTFFHNFSGLTEGWIFVFLPWGGPQVGNLSLVAACGLTAAAAAFCSKSSSTRQSQHLILSHCQWPEFHWWFPPRVWFFPVIAEHVQWSALLRLLSMTEHSCRNICHEDMSFYSDSKTDLNLQCDYHIKFQLFEGAEGVFSSLTVVCCMWLPCNPYRVPQHHQRHVCGASCSCKHWFLWISPIF
jgi:hypothetical protein